MIWGALKDVLFSCGFWKESIIGSLLEILPQLMSIVYR